MRIAAAFEAVLMLAGLALVMSRGVAMGTEEAAYTVEKRDGAFEVRQYTSQVVAEVVVDGTMEDAGNKAFRPLFNYIAGANRTQGKIAMTATVGQQAEGQKIAMTAPVGQEAVSNQWVVTFTMPASFTLATLPLPTDEKVHLRAITARRMAAVRYSGTWSRKRYERHLALLHELRHGADGILDRHGRIDAVRVIKIDGVDAEPLQARLAGRNDKLRPAIGELAAEGDVGAPLLTVFLLGETVLAADGDAFEVLFHDEVDDTRHRVRAVGRAGTASDHFDALDERRGDGVDVDHATARRAHTTTTVDEDEVAVRAKAAQIDDRTTVVRRIVRLRARARRDLRQCVHELIDGRVTRLDDGLRRDRFLPVLNTHRNCVGGADRGTHRTPDAGMRHDHNPGILMQPQAVDRTAGHTVATHGAALRRNDGQL